MVSRALAGSFLTGGWLLLLVCGCQPQARTGDALLRDAPTSQPAKARTTVAGATQPTEAKAEETQEKSAPRFEGATWCMDQLRKIYRGIAKVNEAKHIPWWLGGDILAPITRAELEAQFGRDGVPKCPYHEASDTEPQDYFLANEGPEPAKYPNLLAYERTGLHGEYRHLLMRNEFWIVTETQWQKMRKDSRYVPKARRIPVFTNAFK